MNGCRTGAPAVTQPKAERISRGMELVLPQSGSHTVESLANFKGCRTSAPPVTQSKAEQISRGIELLLPQFYSHTVES